MVFLARLGAIKVHVLNFSETKIALVNRSCFMFRKKHLKCCKDCIYVLMKLTLMFSVNLYSNFWAVNLFFVEIDSSMRSSLDSGFQNK